MSQEKNGRDSMLVIRNSRNSRNGEKYWRRCKISRHRRTVPKVGGRRGDDKIAAQDSALVSYRLLRWVSYRPGTPESEDLID